MEQSALERLDEQLLNIQVQLRKLDVLVKYSCQNSDARQQRELFESIRRHRDGMLESSRAIAERIERIGRDDD